MNQKPDAYSKDTNHYQLEYVQNLVSHWDELIDWDAQALSEGRFFIDLCEQQGAKQIVATGTGFHCVRLLQAGFEVVSVDGSMMMLAKAFENAHSFILCIIHTDWRGLNRDVHEKFDAVICLGNSFTHLFSEKDRRKSLAEFYAVLRHDGILILDQRNYDSILAGRFSPKKAYYYCGENVQVVPETIDPTLTRFRYEFPDQSIIYLNRYPLRQNYTRKLMLEVGFQNVKTFGDFKETYHSDEPDFLIRVADKRYKSTPLNQASTTI